MRHNLGNNPSFLYSRLRHMVKGEGTRTNYPLSQLSEPRLGRNMGYQSAQNMLGLTWQPEVSQVWGSLEAM